MTETEHSHHSHPSRCCPTEDPREVLARLRANPPQRLGHFNQIAKLWSGEREEAFRVRMGAWEGAVAREEAMLSVEKE